MQKIYDQIARVAPTGLTVLIAGESGTGKEVVADTIHSLSRRKKQPFLAVNCGAISPQLIESEMFGHEKGSFTGANRQHIGYFERAHQGTLFLDEITEMPMELQVKLLRVLETGTFMRVGSDQQIEMDVRVIAATNRIPAEAVAREITRGFAVSPASIPFANASLARTPGRYRIARQSLPQKMNREESTDKEFTPDALALLRGYHWPGNVRELKNVVHRALIMAEGKQITSRCLPEDLGTPQPESGPYLHIRVGTKLSGLERKVIMATLEQCGGIRERAAELLGISLKTLYNRLREYRSH